MRINSLIQRWVAEVAIEIKGELPVFHHPELFTDSRLIRDNAEGIFFCIRTSRNDGHSYISDVLKKGVRFFVVETMPQEFQKDCTYVKVSNSLEALQTLAKERRNSFDYPLIAITGSNGKTIVKEWLNQILSSRFTIVRSPRSYNSQIGVPLSLWKMDDDHSLALIEAGISKKGEMDKLADIIRPTFGVFTHFGPAHSGNFQSDAEKANEKVKLFEHAEVICYPLDEQVIKEALERKGIIDRSKSWSRFGGGDLNVLSEKTLHDSTIFECKFNQQEFAFEIPFTDQASCDNALSAVLVALVLGLQPEELIPILDFLSPVKMRLEVVQGIENSIIINDSYSNDKKSLKIAMQKLHSIGRSGRKVLIISEMIDSGEGPSQLVDKVKELTESYKLDKVYWIGDTKIETENDTIVYFPSADQLIQYLQPADIRNSTILLKGARKFQLEKIVEVLQSVSHQTVLEIDRGKIVSNLNYFRSKVSSNVKTMVMVKAFGYGAGDAEIASLLQFHGADYLGVAYTEEGKKLRNYGISLPIMVMNVDDSAIRTLFKYRLEPEVYSLHLLYKLISYFETTDKALPIKIHLKLETGMNRLGFTEDELDELIQCISHPAIKVASIFSHLSASDSEDQKEFTEGQISQFTSMTQRIVETLDEKPLLHICNTSGILNYPHAHFDMVRLGIGLYGIDNNKTRVQNIELVSKLKTRVSQVKEVPKGASVGYSRNFKAEKPTYVATIPIGYADGFSRQLGNGNFQVKISGQDFSTIGNICMDMTMIEVDQSIKEGDEVIIFDDQKDIETMAKAMNTISYEVLSSISPRIKRIYLED